MRFSSFTYLVGQGLHNLRANRLMTFASMGVLTVCMLLIGAAYLLGVNIDAMVEYIGDQNETIVYMSQDATEDQIAAADTAIRNTAHVVGVTYMSPADVLAVYSDMLSDYTNLQDTFANDNPFYPNYRVVVDSPAAPNRWRLPGQRPAGNVQDLRFTAKGRNLCLLRHCAGPGHRQHRGHQQHHYNPCL